MARGRRADNPRRSLRPPAEGADGIDTPTSIDGTLLAPECATWYQEGRSRVDDALKHAIEHTEAGTHLPNFPTHPPGIPFTM